MRLRPPAVADRGTQTAVSVPADSTECAADLIPPRKASPARTPPAPPAVLLVPQSLAALFPFAQHQPGKHTTGSSRARARAS